MGEKWDVTFEPINPNNSGECHPMDKKIKLDSNMKIEDVDTTFCHEYAHAIFHEIGVYQIISADAEELIVTGLAKCLQQIITKSKKMPSFAPKPESV